MTRSHLALVAVLAAAVPLTARAQSPATPQSANACFYMREMQGWKAPDDHTIYVRVGLSRYYRLDLSAPCSSLKYPGVHLVTKSHGTDSVCGPLDWDITVSDATSLGQHGMLQHCIVKTMTPMTPADVSAIPPKFKP